MHIPTFAYTLIYMYTDVRKEREEHSERERGGEGVVLAPDLWMASRCSMITGMEKAEQAPRDLL